MSDTASPDIVPDSEHRGIVARLPQLPRDLAQLARFDRPIGWWLLFWPCVWGVWLTGAGWQWALLGWLLPLAGLASPGVALGAAALLMLAGAFVERWLFFAQARHMVTLYY